MIDNVCNSVVESELIKHGCYASTTRGVSMKPLFRTGRDVVILKVPEGELSRFDVALYKNNAGIYTLHRVIGVKENEYLIRGDNTFAIEHIKKDKILAVLAEFNRKGKKYSVDHKGYRIYVRIWCFIYPLRYVLHLPLALARKIYHKFIKK